jgi:hypothetical protein
MIYLSIPYTGCENLSFCVSCVVLEKLIRAGNVAISTVVCGHAMRLQGRVDKSDYGLWIGYDLKILRDCDALIVVKLDGWENSAGVKAEMDEARSLGIPIIYLDPDWFVPYYIMDKWSSSDKNERLAEITE